MAEHTVYPGQCSMCNLEERILLLSRVFHRYMLRLVYSVVQIFFFLSDLLTSHFIIYYNKVLKSHNCCRTISALNPFFYMSHLCFLFLIASITAFICVEYFLVYHFILLLFLLKETDVYFTIYFLIISLVVALGITSILIYNNLVHISSTLKSIV